MSDAYPYKKLPMSDLEVKDNSTVLRMEQDADTGETRAPQPSHVVQVEGSQPNQGAAKPANPTMMQSGASDIREKVTRYGEAQPNNATYRRQQARIMQEAIAANPAIVTSYAALHRVLATPNNSVCALAGKLNTNGENKERACARLLALREVLQTLQSVPLWTGYGPTYLRVPTTGEWMPCQLYQPANSAAGWIYPARSLPNDSSNLRYVVIPTAMTKSASQSAEVPSTAAAAPAARAMGVQKKKEVVKEGSAQAKAGGSRRVFATRASRSGVHGARDSDGTAERENFWGRDKYGRSRATRSTSYFAAYSYLGTIIHPGGSRLSKDERDRAKGRVKRAVDVFKMGFFLTGLMLMMYLIYIMIINLFVTISE